MGLTPSPANVVETIGAVTVLRSSEPATGEPIAVYRFGGVDYPFDVTDLEDTPGAAMIRESTASAIERGTGLYDGPPTGTAYAA